jgi:hypothetical protein
MTAEPVVNGLEDIAFAFDWPSLIVAICALLALALWRCR